jgi:hypothetical protein
MPMPASLIQFEPVPLSFEDNEMLKHPEQIPTGLFRGD